LYYFLLLVQKKKVFQVNFQATCYIYLLFLYYIYIFNISDELDFYPVGKSLKKQSGGVLFLTTPLTPLQTVFWRFCPLGRYI